MCMHMPIDWYNCWGTGNEYRLLTVDSQIQKVETLMISHEIFKRPNIPIYKQNFVILRNSEYFVKINVDARAKIDR